VRTSNLSNETQCVTAETIYGNENVIFVRNERKKKYDKR
jgi:hypothetical protein